jgi:glycogen operon protein
MLAQGVPLLLAGDEAGNSQGGNNNVYCQDNETGWVDWSRLDTKGEDMTAFVGALARLRKRYAQLHTHHWLDGHRTNGDRDVVWLRPDAEEMREQDWNFPEGRFLAYLLAAPDAAGQPLFIVFNAAQDDIEVTIPAWRGVGTWIRVLDTKSGTVLAEDVRETPGGRVTAPGTSIMAFAGGR